MVAPFSQSFSACFFFSLLLIFKRLLSLFCFTNYSIVLQRWLISWWSMFWGKHKISVFSLSSFLSFEMLVPFNFLVSKNKKRKKWRFNEKNAHFLSFSLLLFLEYCDLEPISFDFYNCKLYQNRSNFRSKFLFLFFLLLNVLQCCKFSHPPSFLTKAWENRWEREVQRKKKKSV